MLSTRTLLLLAMVASAIVPSCAVSVARAIAEKEAEQGAVTAIEAAGGEVIWLSYSPIDWLWIALVGDDPYMRVGFVCFHEQRLTDEGLKQLVEKDLPRCTQLSNLSFDGETRLTVRGLKQLSRVPQLKCVGINDMPLDDAAVVELSSLKQVEELTLRGTNVTPAGIRKLQIALPRCWIDVE